MHNRPWVEERRTRTRQLIELGGLVSKAGLDQLTDGDRALLLGALLALTDRLRRDDSDQVRSRWRRRGDAAFTEHETARDSR